MAAERLPAVHTRPSAQRARRSENQIVRSAPQYAVVDRFTPPPRRAHVVHTPTLMARADASAALTASGKAEAKQPSRNANSTKRMTAAALTAHGTLHGAPPAWHACQPRAFPAKARRAGGASPPVVAGMRTPSALLLLRDAHAHDLVSAAAQAGCGWAAAAQRSSRPEGTGKLASASSASSASGRRVEARPCDVLVDNGDAPRAASGATKKRCVWEAAQQSGSAARCFARKASGAPTAT